MVVRTVGSDVLVLVLFELSHELFKVVFSARSMYVIR